MSLLPHVLLLENHIFLPFIKEVRNITIRGMQQRGILLTGSGLFALPVYIGTEYSLVNDTNYDTRS